MQEPFHKTLIVRFSSVGDIVLSSLLVRAFRQRFLHAQIDYLVKSEFAELVRYNPHVSHVLEFPQNGRFADLADIRRRIVNEKYDLIVDLHDSLRSRFICAGSPRVVRVRKRKIARFILVKSKWNMYELFGGAPSVAERYLETVQPLGVANDGKGLEVFVPAETGSRMRDLLDDSGFSEGMHMIGICPSAKHNTKMWLKEGFAETASTLALKYNRPIVLFGSLEDQHRCRDIEEMIQQRSANIPVVNLAGKHSLTETAAAMDHCSIVITNDSGLMHIAAARKRKVVAIFGSTVKKFGFSPYGTESIVVENDSLWCRPCTHIGRAACPKGHFKCMKDISAQRVIASAQQLLEH